MKITWCSDEFAVHSCLLTGRQK